MSAEEIKPKREFVATVYIVRNGKVLLTLNEKVNKFVPVGGHVEENELPCSTAIREAKEETGFDIELIDKDESKGKNLKQNLDIHLDIIKPEHHHINLSYIAKIIGGTEKSITDDNTELRWFSKEELRNNISMLDNVREAGIKAIEFAEQ